MEKMIRIKKSNDDYIAELNRSGKTYPSLFETPYKDLFLLSETHVEERKERDEDGDWCTVSETVLDRMAFVKCTDGKFSFLLDNWFDEIDHFEMGLYAKVRLGRFYNLVTPDGDYVFPYWQGNIEKKDNLLVAKCLEEDAGSKFCTIYDKSGQILLKRVSIVSGFIEGYAVIRQDDKCNFIDKAGQLLLDTWVLDARPFFTPRYTNVVYAFIKNNRGWGVIDGQGKLLVSQFYTDIQESDYINYRSSWNDNGFSVAIVRCDDGYNVLMHDANVLVPGFPNCVDAIVSLGEANFFLAKKDGVWGLYEWNGESRQLVLMQEFPGIANPDGKVYVFPNNGTSFKFLQKDGHFNIVSYGGLQFEEWYAEIKVIGSLFRVKRSAKEESDSLYEYNLLSWGGKPVLESWKKGLVVVPFNNAYLINVEPVDNSVIYEFNRVKKIQGLCNLYLDLNYSDLFFDDWFDAMEFREGELFTDGYMKVWKDGKCNLIDRDQKFALQDWADEITIGLGPYYQDAQNRTIKVVRDGRVNYFQNGRYLFDRWFTKILPIDSFGYYPVFDEKSMGLYSRTSGLAGGRFFDSIKRISEQLFFGCEGKDGLILDYAGHVITKAPIYEVKPFYNGYARVMKKTDNGSQFNFIDTEGKIVSHIWFDSNPNDDRLWESEHSSAPFICVRRDNKFNIIKPDKSLLFKSWYDSISGGDGKWLITNHEKWMSTFIDNDERLLTGDWYTKVYHPSNFMDGVYVVESELGRNVLGLENEYTLESWTDMEIVNAPSSNLVVLTPDSRFLDKTYCLDRSGHLISHYPVWRGGGYFPVDCLNVINGGTEKYLRVITLAEEDGDCRKMQVLCNSDGVPFFNHICGKPTGNQFQDVSVFGSIKKCNVPGKGEFLLVNLQWPRDWEDDGQIVIMDLEGKVLTDVYDLIEEFDSDGFAVVSKHGLFNLIDRNFHLVSFIWFDSLGFEYQTNDWEYHEYYDEDTESIERIPNPVTTTKRDTSFHDGLLKVQLWGMYNFLNQEGRLVLPRWYDSAYTFGKNLFRVSRMGKYNFLDSAGEEISEDWFGRVLRCKEYGDTRIYALELDGSCKLLFVRDSSFVLSGVWVDKVYGYDNLYDSLGYYTVKLNGKPNLIDENGSILLPDLYDVHKIFRDEYDVYVVVSKGGKMNVFSAVERKLLSSVWFDTVLYNDKRRALFEEEWLGVQIDGQFTFVDEQGRFIADERFDAIHSFRHGFAGIEKNGKKNYVTTDGEILSEQWFDEISSFSEYGKAIIKLNDEYRVIDSEGKLSPAIDASGIRSFEIGQSYGTLTHDDNTQTYVDFRTMSCHKNYGELLSHLRELSAGDTVRTKTDEIVETITIPDGIDGIEGLSYTLVTRENKSNLIGKDGVFLFDEWKDSKSIIMCQGIPLMLDSYNHWVIIN